MIPSVVSGATAAISDKGSTVLKIATIAKRLSLLSFADWPQGARLA
jgi:hypothetical protein